MKRCYLFVLLMLLLGCSQRERIVIPAFYHWQTEFQLSNAEQKCLEQLNIQKIYVKFFDVDWDAARQDAVPLAALVADQTPKEKVKIIPVVFITNRTFSNLSENKIAILSQQVYKKITTLWRTVSDQPIHEIQFDCDWTQTTKKKYFSFLIHFRKQNENKDYLISSTIRLHQVKYADQTGIPPVDRGMLMFYNMADLEEMTTENSILDMPLAKQYISSKTKYLLPLDIALPVFRWGVLFRKGKMIKLINNMSISEVQDTSRFRPLSANQYEVTKSTYLKGYYLYAADVVRLETVPAEKLAAAAELLHNVFYNNDLTVSLYHLDSTTIKHYTYGELQRIFQIFAND